VSVSKKFVQKSTQNDCTKIISHNTIQDMELFK